MAVLKKPIKKKTIKAVSAAPVKINYTADALIKQARSILINKMINLEIKLFVTKTAKEKIPIKKEIAILKKQIKKIL